MSLIAKKLMQRVLNLSMFISYYMCFTKGVCQVCYGRDLARGKLVSVGEAGNDSCPVNRRTWNTLTMRTFHVGGTAQIKEESQIISQTKGKLNIINKNLIEFQRKTSLLWEEILIEY